MLQACILRTEYAVPKQQGCFAEPCVPENPAVWVRAADRLILKRGEQARTGVADWERGCDGHFGNLECQSLKYGRGHLCLKSLLSGQLKTSIDFSPLFHRYLRSGTSVCSPPCPLDFHQPPEHSSSNNRLFPPNLPPGSMVCSAVVQNRRQCGWVVSS